MTTELTYLTWTAVLTVLFWIPYALDTIKIRGLPDAVGYPADPKPIDPWAQRLKCAHYNAIENLAVFAVLVLVVHLAQKTNETTALACGIYFWARLAHAIAYTLAVPWVRTLAFFVGWLSCLALAWQILF